MNKELILKYKNEFEHWLNGGSLLWIDKNLAHEHCWLDTEKGTCDPDKLFYANIADRQFIINDSYSIYRKALAEGKTVLRRAGLWSTGNIRYELFDNKDLEFYDTEFIIIEDSDIEFVKIDSYSYIIKPKEPKFKVGDWVRSTENNKNFVMKIKSIARCKRARRRVSGRIRTAHKDKDILDNMNGLKLYSDKAELWKPTPGEYCFFWSSDNCSKVAILAKFMKMIDNRYIGDTGYMYDNCEPFIGTLPSIISGD